VLEQAQVAVPDPNDDDHPFIARTDRKRCSLVIRNSGSSREAAGRSSRRRTVDKNPVTLMITPTTTDEVDMISPTTKRTIPMKTTLGAAASRRERSRWRDFPAANFGSSR
jgi:hypothetical protein